MIDNSVNGILATVAKTAQFFGSVNTYDPKNENDMHDLREEFAHGVLLGVDEDGVIYLAMQK